MRRAFLITILLIPLHAHAAAIKVNDGKVSDWNGVKSFADPAEGAGADVAAVYVTADHANSNLFLRVDLIKTPALAIYSFTLTFKDGTTQTVSWIQGGTPRINNCAANCTLSEGTGRVGLNTYHEIQIPYAKLRAAFKNGNYVVDVSFSSFVIEAGGIKTDRAPNAPKTVHYDAVHDVATDAQILSQTATLLPGEGVRVSWRTGAEVQNAGFRVYRMRGGARVAVNAGLIPGAGTAGTGEIYELLDEGGRAGDVYVIEDVSESGRSTLHPPFRAVASTNPSLGSFAPRMMVPSRSSIVAAPVVAPAPAVRSISAAILGTRKAGIYEVRREDLVAAGVDPAVARAPLLRLQYRGEDVRLVPAPVASGLAFYAPDARNAYDGVDRFRLDAGGAPVAARVLAPAAGGVRVRSFQSRVLADADQVYDWYREGDDPYAWQLVRPSARGVAAIELPDATRAGDVRVRVRLHGGRDFADEIDHRYEIVLNGRVLGTAAWGGKVAHEVAFSTRADVLDPGGHNLLEVRGSADALAADYIYLQDVEVVYERRLVAVDDELAFQALAGAAVEVAGFRRGDVTLLDVTRADRPVALAPQVRRERDGTFTLVFSPPGRGMVQLHAASGSALRRPEVRGAEDRLARGVRGADLLVVTTRELAPALAPLVAARRAQGLSVEVTTLEEIADAYASGHAGPDAIRALVRDAVSRWNVRPRFLLLAGQGSMDPRGLLGGETADREQVPTHFVVTSDFDLRAPSDAWFGLDGNDMRIAIGRIPARTRTELAGVVRKILAQERRAPTGRVLGVADGSHDAAGDGPTDAFENDVTALLAGVPAAETVFARTDPAPLEHVADRVEAGVDLIVYVGHGWIDGWGWDRQLVTGESLAALRNAQLPVVVSSSCWDANFSDQRGISLGGSWLLRPDGGASAVFGGTTILGLDLHAPLTQAVSRELTRGAPTLGDAVLAAQNAALASAQGDLQAVSTFVLLGDPSAPSPLRR